MNYTLWAILLIAQNFSFVLVSRARNSTSILYHAWTSLFSNGIWIASQFVLVGSITDAFKTGSRWQLVIIGIFYTICTMIGSISSHYVSMNFFEKKIKKEVK